MSLLTTLVQPPQIFTKSQVASGVTPPLGLAYLAGYLLHNNCHVKVVDALGEAPEKITAFEKKLIYVGFLLR